MATPSSGDNYINYHQPSPKEVELLVSDLRTFDFRISPKSLNNPANVRVFTLLDKYISRKPAEDQWVLYIGIYNPFPISSPTG
jgi:hypothetical protein